MKAIMHVKNMAFVELELEDVPVPDTSDFIDEIYLHEGVGIAVPTLTLRLFDQRGTLLEELNLTDGTKCSIVISKDGARDKAIKRKFRLWSYSRHIDGEGPHVKVVFILDHPKWAAATPCENFRGTSDSAMSQMAQRGGLKYDGPGGTDDHMNWLNINTTRSSFSEDVAMRGYMGDQSCMYRVVTLSSKLRYKDLFSVMKSSPVADFGLNYSNEGKSTHYDVRETKDVAASGVLNHWFNYGHVHHHHSLDKNGQQKLDKVSAPQFGSGLPINKEVKSLVSEDSARVSYMGFDPGTEPKPGSNIHQNYEKAFYQNLRFLGLFVERISVLIDKMAQVESLDCVNYMQKDPKGTRFIDTKALNGKYVVAGKSIRIKNGHVYTEIYDLIRSYINEGGKTQPKQNTAKANSGEFDILGDRAKQMDAQLAASQEPPQAPVVREKPSQPYMVESKKLMQSLKEFDAANPRVPEKPLSGPGTLGKASDQVRAQEKVLDSVNSLKSSTNPVAAEIKSSAAGFDPSTNYTVKKVSANHVKVSANSALSALQSEKAKRPISGVEGLSATQKKEASVTLEKGVLDRFSVDGSSKGNSVLNEEHVSVVSSVTAASMSKGQLVGDPQRGGVFEQDFQENGLEPPIVVGVKPVSAIEQHANLGTNFAMPATSFGITEDDALINPNKVASFLLDMLESNKSPKEFMQKNGAQEYMRAYGTMLPDEAEAESAELARLADEVKNLYGEDEVLAKPSAVQQVQQFDFLYGDTRMAPVVEKIADVETIEHQPAASQVIMVRDTVSWATYTRFGNAEANRRREEDELLDSVWEFPHEAPFTPYVEADGRSYDLTNIVTTRLK